MTTVNCFGIHSDDVGLRYLVQDKVTNAYGFTQQEEFSVITMAKSKKAPHNYPIVPDRNGLDLRTAMVASPVPERAGAFIIHPDEDIDVLAAFSNAVVVPAFMLNSHMLKDYLYTSNIKPLIVTNCTAGAKTSLIINEMQSACSTFTSRVLMQGDYFFASEIERLDKLPEDLDRKQAKKYGLANLSNYLREKDQ